MENPVRALRENLGLNQHQFGDLIGRSYASVQGYESGKKVPAEIIERLKNIAAERGCADIAVSLTSDDWRAEQVRYPSGHTLHHGKPRIGPDDRDIWHGLLDLVWDSGSTQGMGAVKNVLLLAKAVAAQEPAPAAIDAKKGRHSA